MAKKPPVQIGDHYGLMTVTEKAPTDRHGDRRYWCSCKCGNPRVRVPEARLRKTGGQHTCGECVKYIRALMDPMMLKLLPSTKVSRVEAKAAAMTEQIEQARRLAPEPGRIFGCLEVIGDGKPAKDGTRMTAVSCNCGRDRVLVPTVKLATGKVVSCGCINRGRGRPAKAWVVPDKPGAGEEQADTVTVVEPHVAWKEML